MRAIAVVVVAGCRWVEPGQLIDAPTPPEQLAFEAGAHAAIIARCGAAECHGDRPGTQGPTRFALPEIQPSYYAVLSFYSVTGTFTRAHAQVLTLGLAGAHHAAMYTPDEATAVTAWLDSEVAARYGVSAFDAPSVSDAMVAQIDLYRGCMRLEDVETSQLASAWADRTTASGPRCLECHVAAAGDFAMSDTSAGMLGILQGRASRFLQYLSPFVFGSTDVVLQPNDLTMLRVGAGDGPHAGHPRFDYDPLSANALAQFHQLTSNRVFTGCDATKRDVR